MLSIPHLLPPTAAFCIFRRRRVYHVALIEAAPQHVKGRILNRADQRINDHVVHVILVGDIIMMVLMRVNSI